jgi:mannosyltransferase
VLALTRGRDLSAAGLIASMVVAAVLLLPTLGAASYWFDEAFSVQRAGGSLAELRGLLTGREINMALYYGLLWGWTRVATDETWVRLLSALCVVLSLVPLWLVGRRLGGARIATMACVLLVVNAFVVRYGQEARSYALLLLLATTSTWLLVRALERRTRRDWILYAVTAALVPWAQVLGGCLLVAHLVVALAWRPRPSWRGLALPAVVVGVGVLPVGVLAFAALDTAVNWVPPLTPGRVLDVALDLTGAGRPARLADGWSLALLAATVAMALVGAVAALRRGGPGRTLLLVAGAWAAVPLVAVIAVSIVKPVLISRYLIVVVPGVTLLAAAGLDAVRPRALGIALAAGLIALALLGTARYLEDPGKPDWRGATERIAAGAAPGDVFMTVESWAWRPIALYAEQWGTDAFPTRLATDVAGDGLDAVDQDFADDLRELAGPLADEGRAIWIVSVPTSRIGLVDGDDDRFAGLRTRYRTAEVHRLDELILTRMVPLGAR